MKNILSGKFPYKISIFLVVFLMFPLFFISKNIFIGLTQTINRNEKTVSLKPLGEPIEIVDLRASGKRFNLVENPAQENNRLKRFTMQDNNWFKDFAITFKNTFDKPITYVNIAATFPETRASGLIIIQTFKFGVSPKANRSSDVPQILPPNQIGQIVLSPENYKILTARFAERGHTLSDLTLADLAVQTIAFADGTYWSGGGFYRPDPNRPGKYVPVLDNQ